MTIQFHLPDTPCDDLTPVPGGNEALALECAQMALQLLQQGSIDWGIRTGIKDLNRCVLRFHTSRFAFSPLRMDFSSTSIARFCSGRKFLISLPRYNPFLLRRKTPNLYS